MNDNIPFQFFKKKEENEFIEIEIHFMGHYNEPPLKLKYKIEGNEGFEKFLIIFDPIIGNWDIQIGYILDLPASIDSNFPKKIDGVHSHQLILLPQVYDGIYRCDKCLQPGENFVYHCEICSFDLHPSCCVSLKK